MDIKKFHTAPTKAPTIPDRYQVKDTSLTFPVYKELAIPTFAIAPKPQARWTGNGLHLNQSGA